MSSFAMDQNHFATTTCPSVSLTQIVVPNHPDPPSPFQSIYTLHHSNISAHIYWYPPPYFQQFNIVRQTSTTPTCLTIVMDLHLSHLSVLFHDGLSHIVLLLTSVNAQPL